MLGAILVVVAILAIPSMILGGGMVVAGLIGQTAALDAERRHEGSELVDLAE